MNENEKRSSAILITRSPVPFAVMGSSHRHRRVLVTSDDANLDLIGIDSEHFWPGPHTTSSRISIFEWLNVPRELNAMIVRGPSTHEIDTDISARNRPRLTNLSFSWRGIASDNDYLRIENAFQARAVDLENAIKSGVPSEVEWQVAPLIALCNSATTAAVRKQRIRRTYFYFILISYTIIVIFGLIYTFIEKTLMSR